MEQDRDGKWQMKTMDQLMDKKVKDVPKNILHLFQVCSWDFGLDDETLKGRRINFIFAIKQKMMVKLIVTSGSSKESVSI
jgi:hypothetical protein